MPTATLRFKLPEEQEEFRYAIEGAEYAAVLSDMSEKLRRFCKDDAATPKDWEEVRSWFNEMLGDIEL